jgi:hypothetical protein
MKRIVVVTVLLALALAATASAKTLVTYARSGGIAGEQSSVTVGTKGKAKVRSRSADSRTVTLSKKRLRRLKQAIKAAKLSGLDAHYGPKGVVNDGITQSVTSGGVTVTVETGGEPPARLSKLLAKLDALLQPQ